MDDIIHLEIGNNVRIGANAVVSKSVLELGITIGGAPARKFSDKASEHIRGTELAKLIHNRFIL